MAQVSVSLPSDGETIDVADYNTPITTLVNDYNNNIDNSNIAAAAAISGTKLANATVTPAKWTNPYAFKAYDSAGTTLTDGVYVKIALATESYDYNSNFASSTYTAPVAGVYHLSAGVQSTALASGAAAWITLYKNGAAIMYSDAVAPPNTGLIANVSGDLLLAQGDTIELYCRQDSAGNETAVTGEANTWMAGHLVHQV